MGGDRFSLHISGAIKPDDGKFPILSSEYYLSSSVIPDVNLKRKYSMNMVPFTLQEKLPIISFMQQRFVDGTDLETASWGAEMITHRAALSAMASGCFKLSVEVFNEHIFIRLREKHYFGVPEVTEEQKHVSAFTTAFLTKSEGHPDWRHYVLRKMKIGCHKVYFNAIIDAKKKNGELVEIKSRRGYDLSPKSAATLWIENYLSGIETTIIGYHLENGKMTKVEHIKDTNAFVKHYRLRKDVFDQNMMNINGVLTLIQEQVEDHPEVLKFDVVKESEKAGCRIQVGDNYDFLSDDFKQKFA